MKKLSFWTLITVILLTLHPSSFLFAMDPKMVGEVAEEIEKFLGGEQKEILCDSIEFQSEENKKASESAVEREEVNTHQNSSSSFSCNTSSAENSETSYAACPAFSTDGVFQFAGNHLVRATESLRKVILRNPLTTLCVAASYLFPNALGPHFQVAAMSDSNYAPAEDAQVYDLRGSYNEIAHQDENNEIERKLAFSQSKIKSLRNARMKLAKEDADQYNLSDTLEIQKFVVELTKREHKAREEAEVAFGFVSDLWKEVAESYQKSAEYWKKASQALIAQSVLKEGYSLAAEQSELAAKQRRKSIEEYKKVYEEAKKESRRRREIGKSMQLSADYRIKEIEARSIGKEEIAKEYFEVAEKFKQASTQFSQGDDSVFRSRGCFSLSEGMAKKYRLQELEAQEAGQTTLASDYREAATISRLAADRHKQALEAYAMGRWSRRKGDGLGLQGASLQVEADYQAKASEAQEVGKFTLAAGYREVAVTLEQAADQHKKAVDLYKFQLAFVGKSLQDKAGYQAKASEAEEAGKMILLAGYREAIVTSEQAVNQGKLSAMEFSTYEGYYWLSEALCLRAQADYQAKAIEAEEAGKAILGAGYREAVITFRRAAEQHKQSAQLCVIGSCSDLGYNTWHGIGRSIQAKANYQAKASEAKEEGKEVLAAIYTRAAIISERAADQFQQAVEAYIAGKENERKNWVSAGNAFELQVEYQVTSIEAQEGGKKILATGYSEAAITSQQAADQFRLAAGTIKAGKENEGGSWGNEGSSLQKKADYQVKSCEAEKINQITRAANYREAIIVLQQAADTFKQAALAFAAGNEAEGDRLNMIGNSLNVKADSQVKTDDDQAYYGGRD